jgi:hypothetical protein
MAHKVVKIISFHDHVYNPDDVLDVWHFIDWVDDPRAICTGIAFEEETVFKTKEVKRGGITCKKCINRIKEIKSIKL